MDADSFISSILPLSFRGRGDALRTFAMKNDPTTVATLIDNLHKGDVFSVQCALRLSQVSNDSQRLLRFLQHASPVISCRAAAKAGEMIKDDSSLARIIYEVSPITRRALLYSIARARRHVLADAIVGDMCQRFGPEEVAVIIPACTYAVARDILPDVAHAIRSWHRLALAHPDLVMDWIEKELARKPAWAVGNNLSRYDRVFLKLAPSHGPRVLALLQRFLPDGTLSDMMAMTLRILARRNSDAVFALLSRPLTRTSCKSVLTGRHSVLPFFNDAQRVQVVSWHQSNPADVASLLRSLPPAARPALYDSLQYTPQFEAWTVQLLDALPHLRGVQAAEAQRALQLRNVSTSPDDVLLVTSYRPYAEAAPVLKKAAQATQAEQRARALQLLLECARNERSTEALLDALEHTAKRIEKEQDPVRSQVVNVVCGCLSPTFFTPQLVPSLLKMIADAKSARDTTSSIYGCFVTLGWKFVCDYGVQKNAKKAAAAFVPDHSDWRWKFFVTTVETATAQGSQPPVVGNIPVCKPVIDDIVKLFVDQSRVFREREDKLQGETEIGAGDAAADDDDDFEIVEHGHYEGSRERVSRESDDMIVSLAQVLKRRGYGVALLQEHLGGIAQDYFSRSQGPAAEQWLSNSKTRQERLETLFAPGISKRNMYKLLNIGRVAVALMSAPSPLVMRVVEKGPLPVRRLNDYRTKHTLPEGQLQLLAPHVQRRYAEVWLHRLLTDESLVHRTKNPAVFSLALLPHVTVGQLLQYAKEPTDTLYQSVLNASTHLAFPEDSFDLVTACLSNKDVCHAAASSLYRLLRRSRPDRTLTLLTDLLGEKLVKLPVTVQKTLVRVGPSLRLPRVAELVASVWMREPAVHISTRIACIDAMQRLLQTPAAWTALTAATAGDAHTDMVQAACSINGGSVPIRYRSRYLVDVILPALQHTDARARYAGISPLSWWVEDLVGTPADIHAEPPAALAARALARVVCNTEMGSEWRRALQVLCAAVDSAPAVITETVVTLAKQAQAERDQEIPQRDLPSHQRLVALINALAELSAGQRFLAAAAFETTADALVAADVIYVPVALRLRASLVQWSDVAAATSQLQQLMTQAEQVSPLFAQSFRDAVEQLLATRDRALNVQAWTVSDVVAVATALARATAHSASRQLAVALLRQASKREAWNDAMIAPLRALRRDSDAAVRFAAHQVFVNNE